MRRTTDMSIKSKVLKIAGLATCMAAFVSVCIMAVHGQQPPRKSRPSSVTTNWLGYLVVGKTIQIDRITPEASRTTIPQVEIGLRSDGIVIWRKATEMK
jgi:hypothetical protein